MRSVSVRFAVLALLACLASLPAAAQVRIVVLGSSTAAGTGPSLPDSAWVNRYRAYVTGLNAGNEVVNLAVGGYTTYRIVPTGAPVPFGRPAPDEQRNVTHALTLRPDAIVVNMPSNDAASGYTVDEQLANYTAIVRAAGTAPVWIATTQPRALNAPGRANLIAVRDSTLRRYGPRALDLWTGIAREDGLTPGVVLPQYDSGDGIHLNNAAHRILFQRVVASGLLGQITAAGPAPADRPFGLSVAPGPFRAFTHVTFETDTPGPVSLRVYDALGREAAVLVDGALAAGRHRVRLDAERRPAGAYVVRLSQGSRSETRTVVRVH